MKKLISIFVACSFLMSCTSNLQEEPIVQSSNDVTSKSATAPFITKEDAVEILAPYLVVENNKGALTISADSALLLGVPEHLYQSCINDIIDANKFADEIAILTSTPQPIRLSERQVPSLPNEPILRGTFTTYYSGDMFISDQGWIPSDYIKITFQFTSRGCIFYTYYCAVVAGIENSDTGFGSGAFGTTVNIILPMSNTFGYAKFYCSCAEGGMGSFGISK